MFFYLCTFVRFLYVRTYIILGQRTSPNVLSQGKYVGDSLGHVAQVGPTYIADGSPWKLRAGSRTSCDSHTNAARAQLILRGDYVREQDIAREIELVVRSRETNLVIRGSENSA